MHFFFPADRTARRPRLVVRPEVSTAWTSTRSVTARWTVQTEVTRTRKWPDVHPPVTEQVRGVIMS